PSCGCERYADQACRNRHCPQCQTVTKGQWGADRNAAGLPVPSFHLVVSVPHDLTPLILAPQRPRFPILGNAASQTLVLCGLRNLGRQSGCTMVLHTRDQPLGAPCHVHVGITAGALAADGGPWIEAVPPFLLPRLAMLPVEP